MKPTNFKNKVTASAFLRWYFSDKECAENMTCYVIKQLNDKGEIKITAKEIFEVWCGYIPQRICEDSSGDKEYDPSEVELIQG